MDLTNSDKDSYKNSEQALELYLDRLEPDGILAVHVSNGYLDPARVVLRQAANLGLPAFDLTNVSRFPRQAKAHWVLVTSNQAFLDRVKEKGVGEIILPGQKEKNHLMSLWTDDFSNLYEIVR